MDKGESQTNGPEDKKIDKNEQGFTAERWHRVYVSRKEGKRELFSINKSMDASVQGFKK